VGADVSMKGLVLKTQSAGSVENCCQLTRPRSGGTAARRPNEVHGEQDLMGLLPQTERVKASVQPSTASPSIN